jgi:hypothetical protein
MKIKIAFLVIIFLILIIHKLGKNNNNNGIENFKSNDISINLKKILESHKINVNNKITLFAARTQFDFVEDKKKYEEYILSFKQDPNLCPSSSCPSPSPAPDFDGNGYLDNLILEYQNTSEYIELSSDIKNSWETKIDNLKVKLNIEFNSDNFESLSDLETYYSDIKTIITDILAILNTIHDFEPEGPCPSPGNCPSADEDGPTCNIDSIQNLYDPDITLNFLDSRPCPSEVSAPAPDCETDELKDSAIQLLNIFKDYHHRLNIFDITCMDATQITIKFTPLKTKIIGTISGFTDMFDLTLDINTKLNLVYTKLGNPLIFKAELLKVLSDIIDFLTIHATFITKECPGPSPCITDTEYSVPSHTPAPTDELDFSTYKLNTKQLRDRIDKILDRQLGINVIHKNNLHFSEEGNKFIIKIDDINYSSITDDKKLNLEKLIQNEVHTFLHERYAKTKDKADLIDISRINIIAFQGSTIIVVQILPKKFKSELSKNEKDMLEFYNFMGILNKGKLPIRENDYLQHHYTL